MSELRAFAVDQPAMNNKIQPSSMDNRTVPSINARVPRFSGGKQEEEEEAI